MRARKKGLNGTRNRDGSITVVVGEPVRPSLQFSLAISAAMGDVLLPQVKRFLQSPGDLTLFDVEKPFVSSRQSDFTKDERYVGRVFADYMEISETTERLYDIEEYLRRFPFRGTRITQDRYLRSHVEMYLHEVYILRERLHSFAKRSTRAYRKTNMRDRAQKVELRLVTLVESTFEEAIRIRGRHVHEARLDEVRLGNLGGLENIARNSPEPEWQWILKDARRKVKHHYIKWATKSNELIDSLLDDYYELLYPIVFESGHTVRSPFK
jgi:hypothetical protein